MNASVPLRMFPLGSVLFPLGVLTLRVFEPRYLQMIAEAVDGDGEFGVVLIERGLEVGGGDERFDIGTVAKLARVAEIAPNQLGVIAVGIRRVRVESWLPEEPYPNALVSGYEDRPVMRDLAGGVDAASHALRRLLALASELGADVGDATFDLPDDPRAASWALCGGAPLQELDRQRLLETDDPLERLALLEALVRDQAELLTARLAGG